MKVIISRTSNSDRKPCKEAKRLIVPYWHTRTCTEKYFNEHFSDREDLWKSKGKNHKKIPPEGDDLSQENWITRQMEDKKVWGVEVNKLDDILNLIREYDLIIVSEYDDNQGNGEIFELEIYDDYRE